MLTDTIEVVDQYLSHSPNDWFERLVEHLLLGGEGREDIVEGELLPHLPGALALDDGYGLVASRGRNDRKRPVLLFCCCVFVRLRLRLCGCVGRRGRCDGVRGDSRCRYNTTVRIEK